MEDWKRVIYTGNCIFEDWDEQNEMPICPECLTEYQDCKCPGPGQEDLFDYMEIDGILFAKEIAK